MQNIRKFCPKTPKKKRRIQPNVTTNAREMREDQTDIHRLKNFETVAISMRCVCVRDFKKYQFIRSCILNDTHTHFSQTFNSTFVRSVGITRATLIIICYKWISIILIKAEPERESYCSKCTWIIVCSSLDLANKKAKDENKNKDDFQGRENERTRERKGSKMTCMSAKHVIQFGSEVIWFSISIAILLFSRKYLWNGFMLFNANERKGTEEKWQKNEPIRHQNATNHSLSLAFSFSFLSSPFFPISILFG